MKTAGLDKTVREAWVVFSDQTDMAWLKLLRPGFRHCFALLNDGRHWVTLDPLSHYMDVVVHHHIPQDFNLPLWLLDRGHTVVQTPVDRSCRKSAPWMAFTCVEAVKRVLGLHKRFIFTPWQLYCHLRNPQSDKGEFTWEV